jgi:hypothetical protein
MTARRRRDNVVVALFAVLAILGGGHAIFSFFATPPKGPSQDSTTLLVGHAQLAGSYARDFVVAYLGASAGQHDQLARYLADDQQLTLPSTGQQVSDPSVVYITRTLSTGSVDIWAVTVSVRIGGPARGAAASTTTPSAAAGDRQYYRVAVTESGGLLRALSPPAAVQPPGRGVDLALGYTTSCPSDSPLATVSTGFLTAFLTGTGDITRYISSTSAIAALTPAPFTGVDTVSVKSDDSGCGRSATSARTQIMVNPKGTAGAAPTLAYALTMIRTAGEWQVQSIDPVPLLRQPMAVVAGQGTRSALPGSAPVTATTTSSSPSAQIPPATQN